MRTGLKWLPLTKNKEIIQLTEYFSTKAILANGKIKSVRIIGIQEDDVVIVSFR